MLDRRRFLDELQCLAQLVDPHLLIGTLLSDAFFKPRLHFTSGLRRLFLQRLASGFVFTLKGLDLLVYQIAPSLETVLSGIEFGLELALASPTAWWYSAFSVAISALLAAISRSI